MARCPCCGARRDESDDYCPVCGETLTNVHLSEATGRPWFERTGTLVLLVILFWPAAVYGVYRRGTWTRPSDGVILAGCVVMVVIWMSVV